MGNTRDPYNNNVIYDLKIIVHAESKCNVHAIFFVHAIF